MISTRRLLRIATLSCTMALLACGNDNSTSTSSTNDIGANFVGEKDYIVLDEANKSMVVYSTRTDYHCEVENGNYEFVKDEETRQVKRDYLFIGDTLVILYGDEDEIYGKVFVGGKNGEIKGKWKMTTCGYTHESKSIACSGDNVDVIDGSKYYYTFTQDTLYISGTDLQGNVIDLYAPQVEEYDDYAGSEFVKSVFDHLERDIVGNTPAPWTAFEAPWSDSERRDIDYVAQKMQVTIVSRDKNHISFVYDGTSYELDITNALQVLYSRGSRTELSATLKSDKGDCSLTYMDDVINNAPEICSAENARYLHLATFFDNNGDTLFYGARDYSTGNHEEFINCLNDLNGK